MDKMTQKATVLTTVMQAETNYPLTLEETMKTIQRDSEKYSVVPNEKSFSIRLTWNNHQSSTKNLFDPFDPVWEKALCQTAESLISAFHAYSAYAHSREITLVFSARRSANSGEHPYKGNVQKLLSLAAGIASATFTEYFSTSYPAKDRTWCIHFDACLLVFDADHDARNHLIWRSQSIYDTAASMMAASKFAFRAYAGEGSTEENIKMMTDARFDWNGLWSSARYYIRNGALIRRIPLISPPVYHTERIAVTSGS